jgi:hypothetical protein
MNKTIVLLCLAPLLAAAEPNPAPSRLQNFITRQGAKLMDGNQEFRFIGANMPGLVLPYDWTLMLPERLHLPTPWEQEDAFKTLDQMNFRVVRTWNLPMRGAKEESQPWHFVTNPGEFNETAFKVVDSLLALANKYGVRVILPLTAESGDYLGGISTYASYRGKKRLEFYTDPQVRDDYKATVRHVLTRVNTITGVRYSDDKAILAWQYGNEMDSAPDAWLAEMAAYMKSLDKNHLVSDTRHVPGKAKMFTGANIDLVTRHLYGNYKGVGSEWAAAIKKELTTLQEPRPLYIGEFGPYIDGKVLTHDNVVAKLRDFLDYVQADPAVCGALLWSMYFHHQEGGFYWHQIMTYPAVWSYHYPGFPSADAQREIEIMTAMREAAFKIQGLPVPPVPVPEAPELLPIGEAPLLTWRGSAGATGYDIERAPRATGPWAVIGPNVCDGDIAYRPLFSDLTAKTGASYCYRVVARNASGTSQPSNVVGPVAVKRICFVDELQDFSRVGAKSAGLKLNNEFNCLFAEYLFRAMGSTNDWVTYQVPAPIESLKVVAFFAKDTADLALQVSADGAKFTDLQPGRTERKLSMPHRGAAGGQSRTMVTYEVTPPAGSRHLKILWRGNAELDRVEIFHP